MSTQLRFGKCRGERVAAVSIKPLHYERARPQRGDGGNGLKKEGSLVERRSACPRGPSSGRSNPDDDGSACLHAVFPAHDIKQPLTILEGSLESLDQRPRRAEEVARGGAAWKLVGRSICLTPN